MPVDTLMRGDHVMRQIRTAIVMSLISALFSACGEDVVQPELWVSTRNLEFKRGIQDAHFVVMNDGGGVMDVRLESAVVDVSVAAFTLEAGKDRVVGATLKPEVVDLTRGVVEGQLLIAAGIAGHETILVTSEPLPNGEVDADDPVAEEPTGVNRVTGLIGYWPLNGSADDASGNGHDGELVGGAELITTDGAPIPGAIGCALFPGDGGNAIDCGGGADLLITDHLTLMAWVKPTDSNPTQFAAGVPYDDAPQWDEPWVGAQIGVRGSKMATWFNIIDADGNAKDREYDAGATVSNEWQHLAFTFDGEVAISYVNGEEVAAHDDRIGDIGYAGDPHFVIGQRSMSAMGEVFNGLVDEVALFDRALSASEVADVMDHGVRAP